MDGVRKMVRSGSLRVEELFGNKAARRTETEPAEIEYESGFSGEFVLHMKCNILIYALYQTKLYRIYCKLFV